MTISPARRVLPSQRALPPAVDETPLRTPAQSPSLEAARPGLLDWMRRRLADREARRIEAAGARALHRLDHLGPAWHVVEWPRTDLAAVRLLDVDPKSRDERAGFLAIGPGGVFAVTVVNHGRARVLVAGDVVQINGKRPPYVHEARRDAKRASKALSAAVGLTVPVTPVLTFVGSGTISVYGLPKECVLTTHRELDDLLVATGNRISAATAEKLSAVARNPKTWLNTAHRLAADYRWYEEGQTAADKRAAQR